MPTQLLLTRFLNEHFAAPVTAFLNALHVHPAFPEAPITNAFAMELLVFAVLLAYFIAVRLTLSVEKPAAVQHLAEMTNEFVVGAGRIDHRAWLRAIRQLPDGAGAVHSAGEFDGAGPGAGVAYRKRCGAAGLCDLLRFFTITITASGRTVSPISSSSWGRCGGCIRCCCRSRSSRTLRACFR